ncbi:hypothetical protein VP01_3398g1 [Puccinia sorghi]|uniref:Uncharacterized protein n=1 Tax=Puccinia sorghi TaxID=27349 RepID=A0A0L6UXJ4_9BASI|nr:hypothetical protein VP01_3398g1 [Puccinia sorghi]
MQYIFIYTLSKSVVEPNGRDLRSSESKSRKHTFIHILYIYIHNTLGSSACLNEVFVKVLSLSLSTQAVSGLILSKNPTGTQLNILQVSKSKNNIRIILYYIPSWLRTLILVVLFCVFSSTLSISAPPQLFATSYIFISSDIIFFEIIQFLVLAMLRAWSKNPILFFSLTKHKYDKSVFKKCATAGLSRLSLGEQTSYKKDLCMFLLFCMHLVQSSLPLGTTEKVTIQPQAEQNLKNMNLFWIATTQRPVELEHSRSSSKSQAQACTFGASSEPKRPRVSFVPKILHTSNHKISKSSTSNTVSSQKIHVIPSNITSNKSHQSSQVDNSNPIPSNSFFYSTLAHSHKSTKPFCCLTERKYVTKPDLAEQRQPGIHTTSELLQNPVQQLSNFGSSANSYSAEFESALLKAGSSFIMEAEPFSLPIAKPKVTPKNKQQMIHSLIPPSRGSTWLPLTKHAVATSDLSLDPQPKSFCYWLCFVEPEEPLATLPKRPIPAVPAESHLLPQLALDLLKPMRKIQHQAFLMMATSGSCPQVSSSTSKCQPHAADSTAHNQDYVYSLQLYNGYSLDDGLIVLPNIPGQVLRALCPNPINRPHTFSPEPAPQYQLSSRGSSQTFNAAAVSLLPHSAFLPATQKTLAQDGQPIASPQQFMMLSSTGKIYYFPISDEFCKFLNKIQGGIKLSEFASYLSFSTNSSKNVKATSDFNTKGPMTIGNNMISQKSPGIAERDIYQESGSNSNDDFHSLCQIYTIVWLCQMLVDTNPQNYSNHLQVNLVIFLCAYLQLLILCLAFHQHSMKPQNPWYAHISTPFDVFYGILYKKLLLFSEITAYSLSKELPLLELKTPITSALDHLSPRGTTQERPVHKKKDLKMKKKCQGSEQIPAYTITRN